MADLVISVDIDAKGTKTGATAVKSEIDGIKREAANAGRSLRSVSGLDFKALETRLKSVGQTMQSVGGQLSSAGQSMSLAITTPLVALGTLGVKSALEVDAVRTKITALLGDASKANAKILELRELSARSVGVTQKTALETYAQLKGIGGIAEDSINRVISAMGKLNAAFKIEDQAGFMRNLNQLFSQGFEVPDLKEAVGRVPIFYQILERAFGTADPEKLRALKAAGKLTLDGFLTGISEAIETDPRTANITDNLSTKLAKGWEKVNVALAPVGDAILRFIVPAFERIGPLIEQAGKWFQALTPAMQGTVVGVTAFAAAIGPLLVVIGSLVSSIGSIVTAVGAVAGLFGTGGALASIGPFLIPIIVAIVAAIGQAVAIAYVLYSAWTENFGGIQELTAIVADAIKYAWDALMTALRDLTVEILAEIRKFWQENGDEILQIIQVFSDGFRQLWTAIVNFWIQNGDTIKQVTSAVWNAVKDLIIGAIQVVGNTVKLILAVINGDWQKAWDATKAILEAVIKVWVSLLTASGTALVGALKIALQAIWNLQTWLYEQAYELGKMVVAGLIAGLKSMANPLGFAAKWVGDQVVNALKARLETQSPSRVTHEIGIWVAQGLADGIDDGTPAAVEAATSISGKIISGLQDVLGKDLGSVIENALGILTDGSKSWGDRLRSIFGGIAQNFRRMVSDMLKTWINSKIFGGAGTGPGGTPSFNPSSGGGLGGIPPTGTINANGEYVVNGNQTTPPFQLFGGGLTNGIGTIASLGMMAGGAIGGKAGNLISSVSGGALTGLMLGLKFGSIGGPFGAAIGAAAGFAMSILGGLFSSPKRKRDKNEKMPQLQQGFLDALKQLRMLRDDKNAILSNPSGAMAKADELRAAIASGFGIQFESTKYSKIAQQQIAQKLVEADQLVKQIKEFAEMGRAASERDRRMLPEFAGGVYMSPAFQAFRRRNGLLGGVFTGRDTLPSLLAPGEMVLNPRQMQAVRANAGFDVFKTAGIPGYASGGVVQSQPMGAGTLYMTIVVEQDAAGLWHATAQSDAGQKVIAKVVETKYANDELKMKRR